MPALFCEKRSQRYPSGELEMCTPVRPSCRGRMVQHWLRHYRQLHGTMALILKVSRCLRPSLYRFCHRGEARLQGPLCFLTS